MELTLAINQLTTQISNFRERAQAIYQEHGIQTLDQTAILLLMRIRGLSSIILKEKSRFQMLARLGTSLIDQMRPNFRDTPPYQEAIQLTTRLISRHEQLSDNIQKLSALQQQVISIANRTSGFHDSN